MIQNTSSTNSDNTDPHTSSDYVIVGGGMAAHAAVKSLLEEKPDADILLISEEDQLPYDRPPLSKDLLIDSETKPADITHTEPYGSKVKTLLGTRIEDGDAEAHRLVDQNGNLHGYGRLLIATGGVPRDVPGGDGRVIPYRNMADFRKLEEHIALHHRIAVVGGGHIGMEIAAGLTRHPCEVLWILPGKGPGAGFFPAGLVQFLADEYRRHLIDLVPEQRVTHIDTSGEHLVLCTDGDGRYAADCAVLGIGIDPADGLAARMGIETDDGIPVNEHMQTSLKDVYAAGDVARVHRRALDRELRVEHEDNALQMGAAAGRSMAGTATTYGETPMFYSDLFEHGYEAVGEIDSGLETVEDWIDGYRKGVVYYLRDHRPVGVLLWNVWGRVDDARKLIARREKMGPSDLIGTFRPEEQEQT